MLGLVKRNEDIHGIRVPQSGWLHEPKLAGEKADILEHFISTPISVQTAGTVCTVMKILLVSKEVDPGVQTLFQHQL